MQFTTSGKDCIHAGANDLVDFDATCTSRDVDLHSKLGNVTDPQAYNASQFGPWAQQQSFSQDAGALDQDHLHAQQAFIDWQQQNSQQISVGQVPISREHRRLQKKVYELEDMLEKIR